MSFRVWRIMLFGYWSMLVVYSICILLFVYTYQFHDIPVLWRNWTGWETNNASVFQWKSLENDDNFARKLLCFIPPYRFKDFGLVKYDSGSLFFQLLTPISFLIVVILQLKFFHVEFMQVTDMKKASSSSNPKRVAPTATTATTEPSIFEKIFFGENLSFSQVSCPKTIFTQDCLNWLLSCTVFCGNWPICIFPSLSRSRWCWWPFVT